MRVKIDFSNKTEIVLCDNLEVTQKFLKLSNVIFEDLINTKVKEKYYKLVSVISFEVLES